MKYPILLTPDTNNTLMVTCRDIPEVLSVGETIDDAKTQAVLAIETAFAIYMADRRPIPMPSMAKDDEIWVELPLLTTLKIKLYHEMLTQNVSKAEISRRLNWHQKQADRLWSLNHATKLDSIEKAFHALGKRLDIAVI